MRNNYLHSVQKGHRLRARLRDVVIKAITKTSLIKIFERKPRASKPIDEKIEVTSKLREYGDVVVMAHYDTEGILSEADIHLLQSFKRVGFEVVLVTTAVQGIERHNIYWNQMSRTGDCLITRPNVGFDFGSWACAINYLGLDQRVNGRLVLVNNSMFGPFQSMKDVMESWSPSCDIFGITSSNEFRNHVQSYFLGFRPAILRSEFFKAFWKSDFDEENKWLTIFRFEMLWADYFKSNGSQICVRHEAPKEFLRNPLTFRWFELMQQGMPFVKKSIFKQNYDRIELHEWKKNLETINSDFPLHLIESYFNSESE